MGWWDQPSTPEFVYGLFIGMCLMALPAIVLIRLAVKANERIRSMDRLTEKLQQAAGVNARVAKAIEDDADALIARESSILERKTEAFKPHHEALDERMKELDRFEDGLQILENAAPLRGGGDSEKKQIDKLLEDAVGKGLAETPLNAGSGAPTEPGITSGADVH